MLLAAQVHPFHQPPGGGVAGEAAGGDSAQTEVCEADPDQLGDCFGGVPVPVVIGVQTPPELGLHSPGLVVDVGLGPGVVGGQHQVTDHRDVELDDQRLGQPLRFSEVRAVLREGVRPARYPSLDGRQAPEPPGRLGVSCSRGSNRQPRGADGPRDGAEIGGHIPIMAREATGSPSPKDPAGSDRRSRAGHRRRSCQDPTASPRRVRLPVGYWHVGQLLGGDTLGSAQELGRASKLGPFGCPQHDDLIARAVHGRVPAARDTFSSPHPPRLSTMRTWGIFLPGEEHRCPAHRAPVGI